ncbi:MAG: biotin-dependent carboxyltransferase family protein [Burkholderiales bacterium]|nr:biotin-dependent carboxyltransferase family protein [Burkholderiales bacterium]
MTPCLELLQCPPLAAVRGLARHGLAHLGVAEGGVMDAYALQQANALLGNEAGAAALELVSGPLRLRLHGLAELRVMQVGAFFEMRIDGQLQPPHLVRRLREGQELQVQGPLQGQYGLLCVQGGLTPRPLGASELGAHERLPVRAGVAALRQRGLRPPNAQPPLALLPGPEYERLDEASRAALWQAEWRVAPNSSRMGLRLQGPALRGALPELLSHAVQPGLVQLPPDGQPIVLAAGAAATGGYPRIGQVAAVDLWKLAHLRAGSPLRFAPLDLDSARELALQRQQELAWLRKKLGCTST